MAVTRKRALEIYEPVGNGGAPTLLLEAPHAVDITIQGVAPLLFHRWDVESVEEKAKAPKNSRAKKTDDVDSYVYRDEQGDICLPGTYFVGSIINAAKYEQDPRSPRKSAMDLFRAGVVSLTELASLGSRDWDYLDRRRVTIQRQGITRTRPAFRPGWTARFTLQVLTPEYISPSLLYGVASKAGRLVGVGDSRPSYGRFQIIMFTVLEPE